MSHQIAHAWSVLLIRGICNVLFALVAFVLPGVTLLALVLLWAVYVVIDGAMSLTTGIAARRVGAHSWSLILAGVCGLLAGLTAMVWPGVTLLVLLAIMAAWAIVRGAFEIAAAIWLRHVLLRAWMLALSGAISVVFGVLLIARPAIGLVTLVYLAGASSLVFGILAIVLALQLHREFSEPDGGAPSRLPA
jgi:uncharacterized membrane protein HdeD (DUF308 family)